MPSNERVKDFMAFEEQPYIGMINPEMFNDTGDDGSGFPGLQRAIFNRMTWWLHSGNMDSGLHIAGYDITGVNLIHAQDIQHRGDLTGFNNQISGYKSISADTGIFQDIKGFSDINIKDSLDFGSTYHLKGVSQITGSNIYGSTAITGVRINATNSITGVRGNFTTDLTGAQINVTTALTGVKGNFTNSITGASGTISEMNITNRLNSLTYYVNSYSSLITAITTIGDNGKGEIVLTDSFELDSTVYLSGGYFIIRGYEDGTVLRIGGENKGLSVKTVSGLRMYDFGFEGTGITATATPLVEVSGYSKPTKIRISNVSFKGPGGKGVGVVLYATSGAIIEDCYVSGFAYGIRLLGASYSKILKNHVIITNAPQPMFGFFVWAHNNLIAYNSVYANVAGASSAIYGMDIYQASHNVVLGNTFNMTASTSSTAIWIEGSVVPCSQNCFMSNKMNQCDTSFTEAGALNETMKYTATDTDPLNYDSTAEAAY